MIVCARAHLLKTAASPPISKKSISVQLPYIESKQMSHMDMYANLGGDGDILWGFE